MPLSDMSSHDLNDENRAMPWEPMSGSAALFPTSESDRLENEGGYFVWNLRMKTALRSCTLWDVVQGTELKPNAGENDAVKERQTHLLGLLANRPMRHRK